MAQPQSDHPAKILSIVWYKVLPARFGGQKAVALFNEYLGRQAPVVCLCSKDNKVIDASYIIKPELPLGKSQFLNPFAWATIYRCARLEAATHLILEFPYHVLAGFICKKMLCVKVIVNAHNIEFLRFKEQRKWWWRLLYYYEKSGMKKADLIFFKTVEDQQAAIRRFGLEASKVAIIPYGAEQKDMSDAAICQATIREKHRIGPDEKILLFAGTLDYAPNAEAIILINEKLVPLLDQGYFSYRIIVCGRNKLKAYHYLHQIKNSHIIFTGEVENMDTYFKATDVFINPVIGGGGVQTKLMDALSYHLNVVCFHHKAGISNAGNKLFSVETGDWSGFAAAVVAASVLKAPTPQSFFDHYNWSDITSSAFQKIVAC